VGPLMAKSKVTVESCDNPDCDTRHEVYPDMPLVVGFHLGKGSWVHAGGDYIPPTYACQESCIVPAIMGNIWRDKGRDPKTGDFPLD
jgi:hypothetical protein